MIYVTLDQFQIVIELSGMRLETRMESSNHSVTQSEF